MIKRKGYEAYFSWLLVLLAHNITCTRGILGMASATKSDLEIILVSPLPPPIGGIATWTEGFLKQSADEKIDVSVIDSKKIDGPFGEFIRTWRIFKESYKFARFKKHAVFHINSSCSLTGMLRDYIVKRIALHFRRKVVIQFHCDIEYQLARNWLKTNIFRRLCKNASSILVLNSSSSAYCKKANIPTIVIGNFVNDSYLIKPLPVRQKNLSKAIFVGRVTKEKGINEIIQSAKKLCDFSFLIVGPISEKIDCDLKNVKFVGPKNSSEVLDLLDSSDVFVLPTYSEGFSVSVLEAMSRQLPVVATNIGANNDLLGSTQKEYLIDPSSEASLTNALRMVRDNPDRALAVGYSNRLVVLDKYTLRGIFGQLLNIYLSL